MYVRVLGDVDYDSGPYNVTFPIGSTNASFDITITDDNVFEFDEIFNISITSITNGHIVSTPAVATVTIIDNTSKYLILFIYVVFMYAHSYVVKYVRTCIRTYDCMCIHTYA